MQSTGVGPVIDKVDKDYEMWVVAILSGDLAQMHRSNHLERQLDRFQLHSEIWLSCQPATESVLNPG